MRTYLIFLFLKKYITNLVFYDIIIAMGFNLFKIRE